MWGRTNIYKAIFLYDRSGSIRKEKDFFPLNFAIFILCIAK